ncbi:MAG: DNA-directed RNA polymerase subunit omega [Clostridia bacterium]|nr:DNA-directed RNA polymerase subunit omega [Clostridia bacterium]
MINPPIGELLDTVACRYTLAVEAAKRARQLVAGAQPLVMPKDTKPLVIAIDEINRGLITYTRDESVPTPEMEGEDKEFDAAIHNIE